MPGLISISLLICEKILIEADVMSAIRIVDLFTLTTPPEIPLERQAVAMEILAIGKMDDSDEHTLALELLRPDGETEVLGEIRDSFPSRFPNVPTGFYFPMQARVAPRQIGTHYIVFRYDGIEVARTPFTLVIPA